MGRPDHEEKAITPKSFDQNPLFQPHPPVVVPPVTYQTTIPPLSPPPQLNQPPFTCSYVPTDQQQPATPPFHNYPTQQPPADYLPNGAPYINPQTCNYTNSTNHNLQPQVINYVVNTPVYQPQVANGTPNHFYQQQQPPIMTSQEWSTGLFDCFDDPENALVTLCFPCVTFGQIAEIVDSGQTLCATSGVIYGLIASFSWMLVCIVSCSYRTKLRNRYGLLETPGPDWLVHLFCEHCALCQEYRELKNRHLDPSLGWNGNLSKNQQMTIMTPPTNQRMMG
uniref:protein PLANT CADMIUM RESISTANCE 5-like n=1 Tax=Erigeron canadensis TaxID=72917 RepID=UPI001CB90F3D|nr:protein PLANT CADMIUM RESISTANCE 5-like [Erigeron canadensis]